MVDTIYDRLLSGGRFSRNIVDASEKASYWKDVLREYKNNNNITYRELTRRLKNMGAPFKKWLSGNGFLKTVILSALEMKRLYSI